MTVECISHHQNRPEIKNANRSHSILQLASGFIKKAWQEYQTSQLQKREEKRRRNALISLNKLDDRALKDIGISRYDLMWASNLPSGINATEMLNEIRTKNIAAARWRAMHKEIKRRK